MKATLRTNGSDIHPRPKTVGGWNGSQLLRGLLMVIVLLLGKAMIPVSSPAAQEDSEKGPRIQEIEFKGLKQYRPSTLKSKMKTSEGKQFSQEVLRNDIRRLYQAGYVDRVQWNTDSVEGGVRLTLQVSENPRLQRVELEGVTVFTINELEKELKIKGKRTLDNHLVNQDKQRLKEKYREKGFHFVRINERKQEGDQGMILVMEVVEGPRVYVEEITINGAQVFDEDTLIDLMDSEPGWLFTSTYYKRKTLEKDVKKLKRYYRRHGYLDAEVEIEDVRFSPGKESAYITLQVDEGTQYMIESVEFKGNSLFSRDRLLKQIELRPDEPLQLRKMALDRRSIRTLYGKNAYIDTEVDWNYEVIPDSNRVRLIFQITEHGTTTAGRIEIKGNTKTKDYVIRRNITVEPGQPVDLTKLRESRQNLRSTRYFSKVQDKRNPTEKPGVEDITYVVEETSTGRIRFGGGVSSEAGIVGLLQISQQNFDITNVPESFSEIIEGTGFAGGGQSLNITMRPGVERSRYSIDFREPYLYSQPLGLNVGGSIFSREFDDFNEDRASANLGLDYREEDAGWTYSLGLEFENIEITDVEEGSPTDIRNIEGKFDLYSVKPGLRIDKRNKKIIPSSGYLFETDYKHTIGDFDFGKWTADFKKFFELYSTPTDGAHILSLRGRLGYMESFNDSLETPSFERFYAGGSSTIRGFEFRTVSPKVQDVEVGGNAQWIANLEYTFPLFRDRAGGRWRDYLRGAVFVDSGTVVNDYQNFDERIRASAGVGLRIQIPGMGPVPFALDFGFPIREEPQDDDQVISFDIQAGF